jgi:hypothetical protein
MIHLARWQLGPVRGRRRRGRALFASDDENQERKDRVGSKARPMEPHGAQ